MCGNEKRINEYVNNDLDHFNCGAVIDFSQSGFHPVIKNTFTLLQKNV